MPTVARNSHNTLFDANPSAYAEYLAKYITDPSVIRARVKDQFGRAPADAVILEFMRGPEKTQRRDVGEPTDEDAFDWQPHGFRNPDCPALRDVKLESPKSKKKRVRRYKPQPSIAGPVTTREIISAVAAEFGFTYADLTGKCRKPDIVLARRTAMWVLVKRGNSRSQVGKWMGGKDHSTVIHALEQFYFRATDEMQAIARKFIGGDA